MLVDLALIWILLVFLPCLLFMFLYYIISRFFEIPLGSQYY
jgi:hypothetical protein